MKAKLSVIAYSFAALAGVCFVRGMAYLAGGRG
jgi:hypothetical protein